MDLDDEIYVYQMNTLSMSQNFALFEVYKISEDGPPQMNKVGEWHSGTNILDFTEEDKNIRRRDLQVRLHYPNFVT